MSKSKGNVITPMALLEEHGSDGVRYWAASGRPGTDTAFDSGQMKVGRRLAIKLLNASKFVPSSVEPRGAVTERLDRGILASLTALVNDATIALDDYNYSTALMSTEPFFWDFCDNYLELAKARRYGDRGAAGAASANQTMLVALSVLTRLFAPFLPFVTEEVWSWWREGSVHRAPWPTSGEITRATGPAAEGDVAVYLRAGEVLGDIRKKKAERQLSPAAPLRRVQIFNNEDLDRTLGDAVDDLRAAVRAEELLFTAHAAYELDITPQEQQ
jgi:valyl-tRNA synthetase